MKLAERKKITKKDVQDDNIDKDVNKVANVSTIFPESVVLKHKCF